MSDHEDPDSPVVATLADALDGILGPGYATRTRRRFLAGEVSPEVVETMQRVVAHPRPTDKRMLAAWQVANYILTGKPESAPLDT